MCAVRERPTHVERLQKAYSIVEQLQKGPSQKKNYHMAVVVILGCCCAGKERGILYCGKMFLHVLFSL